MRDNMVSEIEEMYADDGSELIASTSATYAYGKLVIGTVRHQLMICDVNYLSDWLRKNPGEQYWTMRVLLTEDDGNRVVKDIGFETDYHEMITLL